MIKYIPSGDSAFIVKFGIVISEEIHHKIRAYTFALKKKNIPGIVECIPSYTDLMVIYDALVIDYQELLSKLKESANDIEDVQIPEPRVVELPVLYGSQYGEDLEFVKAHTKLSEDEIITIHSKTKYLVYMLGFTPGFCYLGGMDERIATPRKEIPSQKILAGSVGIAANQTGIYPMNSPGGWQIIGRTPLKLFDQNRNPAFLIKAGDYLKFKPINQAEYDKLNEND